MAVCIPKQYVEKIKRVARETNSDKRRQKFEGIVGNKELARELNLLYEKTLLLKRQDRAFERFIKDIDGISLEQKAKLRDSYIANKQRKESLITDSGLNEVAKEVLDRKYKMEIPDNVVARLNQLKGEVDNLKTKAEGTPSGSKERLAWANKVVEMQEIIDVTINPKRELGFLETLAVDASKRKERIASRDTVGMKGIQVAGEVLDVITSPMWKPFKASWDASFALRQGAKSGIENPKAYKKNLKKAVSIWKKGLNKAEQEKIYRNWKVEMIADDMYDTARKNGVDLGVLEDEFVDPIAEKIKTLKLGDLFSASDKSFTMFAQSQRLDLFKKFVDLEKIKNGGKAIDDDVLKDFADLANSLTGRGSFKKGEATASKLNRVFFSARFVKAQLDTFLKPLDPNLSPQARRIAQKNAAKVLATSAGLITAASMFTDVGLDPRASNFGKAKIPGSNTWIDLTFGLGSYITLASRVAPAVPLVPGTPKTKSVKTGKLYELNTDEYGSKNVMDVLVDFAYNKVAPGTKAVTDPVLKGKTFEGEKPTVKSTAGSLTMPITAETVIELMQEEDFATAVGATMAEILGLGVTTYK